MGNRDAKPTHLPMAFLLRGEAIAHHGRGGDGQSDQVP